jgi:hypothetical protein
VPAVWSVGSQAGGTQYVQVNPDVVASLSRVGLPIMTMKMKIQNVYSVRVVFPMINMARNGCNVFGVIVGLMKIVGLKKTILCVLIV